MNQIRMKSVGANAVDSVGTPAGRKTNYLDRLEELSKDQSLIDEFLELAIVAAKHEEHGPLGDLVLSTLSNLQASEEDDQFRNHCNFEVQSDKFAVFILEDREIVVAANHLARERFGIRAATQAVDLDLVGMSGQPFTEVVTSAMNRRDPTSTVVPIAQAYSPSLKRRLDVAILHLHVCALMGITKEVILICDAITPATLDIFANKFGLSPAEASVVQRFSAGQSLDEIAEKRGRSIATVKTQFYKILEKCGAGSQSELLQMVARIESLSAATEGINEEFSHPHRRIFTLMRPGNRTLDVISAGKPDGRPVLSCNSFSFRTFPAWLEEELYQNNIKLYSIAPPGSGKTSPELDGQSLAECFASDIEAILDNIGCEKAVLNGTGTSFPLCLDVAHLIPNRITSVFSSSVSAPTQRRMSETDDVGPLSVLQKLTLGGSDPDAAITAGALFRLITRLGVARCIHLLLKNDRASLDTMMRTDHLNAIKQAFDASIAQGLDFNVASFKASVAVDWEPKLASCPVPVHLAIGEKDSVGPFNALENLSRDHADGVTFTAVPGVNSLYPYTHNKAFFSALNTAIERP